jgi:hypothetical protein
VTATRAARDTGIARGSSRAEAGTKLVTAFDAPINTPLAQLIEQHASAEHLAAPAHTAC